jgi:hypothetical protein
MLNRKSFGAACFSAILAGLVSSPSLAEPVDFSWLMIENLSVVYNNYTSGNPNVGASRTKNKYDNSSIGFQVFEGGSLITTTTFQTKMCKIDGALQTPSFSYKVDGTQNENFNCKIKDESQRGSFKTTIKGTGSYSGGVLKLSGKVTQRGTYTLNIATDSPTSYLVTNDQSVVVVISGKKCTLKSFSLKGKASSSSPETSRHYASRSEDTMTYQVTSKTRCKLY